MDIKLKNSFAVAAWLVLFTFGLSGSLALLSHNYYPEQMALYVYICSGIGALLLSLILLKKMPIPEWLENRIWQQTYNQIPIDVRFFILLIFGLYSLSQLTQIGPSVWSDVLPYARGLVICTILVTLTMIQGHYILCILQDRDQWLASWRQSLIHKARTTIRDSFLSRSTGVQMTLLLGVVFASGFGLMVVFIQPGAMMLYAPLFAFVTIPTLVVIYRHIGYLNGIIQNTKRLVLGHIEPDMTVKGHTSLTTLARNVNALKHGVEHSQAAQAKSERFKAELITNVSHDLRTPLTSIITYTELLRTPELSSDKREDYIEIIDRKSQRLKVLIDDLFEASKMASGSIDLVKEQVDMTQLLEQALAERDEMIGQSTLLFRITKPDAPVYCVVDGQKLWRVFDNLIGNILKYALEKTRVYISMKTSQNKVVIAFKNITKYELSENIDELFERFKRGDTARQTDGSGLGLAIAKSIVDLHGGSLDLEVDGDLFKAIVTLTCVL